MKIIPRLCLVMTLGASLVACQAAPSKSGDDTDPISLSVLSYTTNALTGDTTTKLIEEVKNQSGDDVVLKDAPTLNSGAADGSSDAITAVREGRVDIAVVAARSFDLRGTTSLQALNAPLTVESPDQAARFLADPVTHEMLAGLEPSGVVGLAVTYDSLSQPLGYASPMREPADLAGARVLVRPSKATEALITALGATPDARNGDEAATAIMNGEIAASVSSVDRPSGFQVGRDGTTSAITANVQLTIKANAIIVNAKVWGGLTPYQQALLKAAAATTRTWAASQLVRLDRSAEAFCASHVGDVVVAGPAELQKWRDAAKPFVADLSRDPITGKALARLAQIVTENPTSDVPRPCAKAPIVASPSASASGDQSAIEGQWRLEVLAEDMLRTGASQQSAVANQGTWTFLFRADGNYTYIEPRQRTCPGRFTLNNKRLTMVEDHSVRDCDGEWDFTWKRTGDKLALTPTPDYAEALGGEIGFFTKPLIRIGDVPT